MSKEARIVTQVCIDAKPPAVFRYLENLELHYLWNPHVESLSPHQKLKLGSEYTAISIFFGKRVEAANAVTKFERDETLEVSNQTGMIRYTVCYSLAPVGDRTRVRCTIHVKSVSDAFAFAKPVLELLARRELQADMQSLKIAVEQKLK